MVDDTGIHVQPPDEPDRDPLVGLDWFRERLYSSMTRRADALFELTDAVLCGPPAVNAIGSLDQSTLALSPYRRRLPAAIWRS